MGLIGRVWTAAPHVLGNMAELRTGGGQLLVIAALEKLADKVDEADALQGNVWDDPHPGILQAARGFRAAPRKNAPRQAILRRPFGSVRRQGKRGGACQRRRCS